MKVEVAYALPTRQTVLKIDAAEGCTVQEAIDKSGILKRFPEIDLAQQKVGMFGKLTTLAAAVEEGARIEIYRPITIDPTKAPKRAKPAKAEAAPVG